MVDREFMSDKTTAAADGNAGYTAFLAAVSGIKPDRDIICGRRGSEENVKIKIILPLLQYLGFNIPRDADFEMLQADIVLRDEDLTPVLAVETKAWEEELTRHLNQCLEYTLKLRCPFIIITSGRRTALYSSLGNLKNLGESKPLLEFSLSDLSGTGGEQILEQLKLLAGKDSLLTGAETLHKKIREQLPPEQTLEAAKKEFLAKCAGFKPVIKTVKTSDASFEKSAAAHPPETAAALLHARDELKRLEQESRNLEFRYRSKEIGLQYLLSSGPRSRNIGLVGILPITAHIAFGTEGWKELGCSPEFMAQLKTFPRALQTKGDVSKLIKLLLDGFKQAGIGQEG